MKKPVLTVTITANELDICELAGVLGSLKDLGQAFPMLILKVKADYAETRPEISDPHPTPNVGQQAVAIFTNRGILDKLQDKVSNAHNCWLTHRELKIILEHYSKNQKGSAITSLQKQFEWDLQRCTDVCNTIFSSKELGVIDMPTLS